MKKPLILVGGGGHCKSVLEAAESAGYSILGVLDMPEEVGKEILSTEVIGTDEDIPSYVDKCTYYPSYLKIKATTSAPVKTQPLGRAIQGSLCVRFNRVCATSQQDLIRLGLRAIHLPLRATLLTLPCAFRAPEPHAVDLV